MTLKQFTKLKGDEILEYNGSMGKIGTGEKFKIVRIHYSRHMPRRMTIHEFMRLSSDDIEKLMMVPEEGIIDGGSITIERLDGAPMDISEWNRYNRYVDRRNVVYNMLKVVKPE